MMYSGGENTLHKDADDLAGSASLWGKNELIGTNGPSKNVIEAKEKNSIPAIFNYSPSCYLILTPEGKIAAANPSLCELFCISHGEIQQCDFFGFIGHEDHIILSGHLKTVFEIPGVRKSCELTILLAAGHSLSVVLESIFPDNDDFDNAALSLVTDITAQRNAELSLASAKSEMEKTIEERTALLSREKSLLEEAQQLAHIGNWEWDIERNEITWSDELCRLIGMNPDGVKPTRELFMEYVHPEDKAEALKSIEDAFISDAMHVHTYRIVRTDKTVRNVEAITEIVKDEKGNPLKIYGTARDITGKVEAAERLKEVALMKLLNSSAAAANMAEKIEEAALTCLENICEFCNWKSGRLFRVEKCQQLLATEIFYVSGQQDGGNASFEFPQSDLPQRVLEVKRPVWLNLYHEDNSPDFYSGIGRLRSGFAFPVLLKNDVICVLEFFAPETIAQDPGFSLIATYIGTHLGRVEERRRAREELKAAKEKAEVSEKTKEQFLANISHEIRTPLNGILGFTNLLGETQLSLLQKRYLKTIRHSSENLLSIVNNVLDISKIETGKITFEETRLDLRRLLAKTVSSIKPRIKSKRLSIETHVDPQVPRIILGDPLRLGQVLLNLLSNAVKFTKKGGISVRIEKKEEETESLTLQFSVSDTGIGIRREKLSTIFESFTQASSDITRKYGGTGLGLAIARQLVELQNGNISVKSVLNKGSVFTFSLKFRKCFEAVQKTRRKESKIRDHSQVTLKFAKILVVEDNQVNRQLVRRLLESWGMEVDTAINGSVALKKLQSGNYNLVLMDLQMPVLDGYEAARRIRKSLNKTEIPIIAVTAHALKGEAEKCINAGMNDYLSKPIDPEELQQKINKFLYTEISTVASPVKQRSSSCEINLDSVKAIVKGNTELLKEISGLFIKDAPVAIKKLEESLQKKKLTEMKAYVHKLRSSVKIIGMKECDELLAEMELDISANRSSPEMLAEKLSEVKTRCSRAIEELKNELNKL